MSSPEEILDFWFGPLSDEGLADKAMSQRWFTKSDAFDEEIRTRFESVHAALAADPAMWTGTTNERLARVVVLDQMPRNMFRDTGRMYETDAAALATARSLVADLPDLDSAHAAMAIMPFMHAESVEAQDECVRLFTVLADDEKRSEGCRAMFTSNMGYAESHRDVVARFGRFPHRNELLDRPSTDEEKMYLADPKAGW